MPRSTFPHSQRSLRIENLEPRWFLSATTNAAQMIGLDHVQSDYGFTGGGQTIALIDTGIAYDHVALGEGFGAGHRVVGGYDFAEGDRNPYDDGPAGYHGTHVAGIVSSTDPRAAGIAPGADIVSLRVFNDQGDSQFTWIEQALQWVHLYRTSFQYPITTVNLSLGAAYNGTSVPDWAMLEDEFATLEADGIFISVAAGNSFASYQTTGLNYPAVSSHVVPVASVDPSGLLSSYSQRSDRVIAAPGRSVLSTVPDYKGDRNGVADDYAMYSGTSMAAPMVAGAAMLLRQAYQFAGVPNVNQQMLYSTMLATADMIFDSVTGTSYHRLNLDHAIDSVMPADDFGSAAGDARGLGSIVDTFSLRGATSRINDGDWFSFEAAASGKIKITFRSSDAAARWQFATPPTDLVIDGNTITFSAVAGQTYTIGLSTGGSLAHYTLDLDLDAAAPTLPACSVTQVGSQIIVSGTEMADTFSVVLADAYCLTVNGVEYRYDRRAVRSIIFNGNGGGDSIVIQTGPGNVQALLRPGELDLSGTGFKIHTAGVEDASIRAGRGVSRAILYDSPGDDVFTAAPTTAEMRGPGYVNRVEGFSSVCAIAGHGSDVASLHDSAGNDTLSISPRETVLSGKGFSLAARFFDAVHAHAEAGGRDMAVLRDMDERALLQAAGKTAHLWLENSMTDDPTAQNNVSLTGFERVRVMPYRGKTLRSEIAAIDFLLDILGRRA